MFFEALQFDFFQRAVVAGILASIACGIVGAYVVVKKMSSISGGIAHSVFGGVGIAHYAGIHPVMGAGIFGVLASLIIGLFYHRQREGLDSVISILWSLGMALGIVFIGLTPGYTPDLMSYLFGSILFVPRDYIAAVAVLDLLILIIVALFFPYFEAVCFDEEFAKVIGVPVERVFVALLILTSLVVVTLIQVVGIILVIALLTTPAVTARYWSKNLFSLMLFSVALSMLSTVGGLFLSYAVSQSLGVEIAAGPMIILLTVSLYVVSLAARKFMPQPS